MFRPTLVALVCSSLIVGACADVRTAGVQAPTAPFGARGDQTQGPNDQEGSASGEPGDFALVADRSGGLNESAAEDADDEDAGPDGAPLGEGEEADDGEEADNDNDEEEPVEFLSCLDRGPGSPPHCPQFTWKSPLEGLAKEEIQERVKFDLASIGSASVGAPNRGRLINGVPMGKNEAWSLTDPAHAYGTEETVRSIEKAIFKVREVHPETPKVIIGHLSGQAGGYLSPHKSHQAGRDVDLSYFYTTKTDWYAVANSRNLDRARTWTLVKAFVSDPNTEMILIDSSLQRILYQHAVAAGEDRSMLDRVFQSSGKSKWPLIRHVRGHATHIHVRFFSPAARATAELGAAYLPKPPPVQKKRPKKGEPRPGRIEGGGIAHKARSGDTLDALARKYAVSVQSIKAANALKSNDLKIGKVYRIPAPGGGSGSAKHK